VFNTEHEKEILADSLKRSGDPESIVYCLETVANNHSPFALYIATKDRSSCTWIFDPDTVYEMIGGKDIHDKTFRSLFTNDIERREGILFYILRKIGPIISVRVSEKTILDVIDYLY
jgi:hypothetical protein